MAASVASIWLRIASGVTIVVGAICALAAHPSTGRVWLYLFDVLKWPLDGDPSAFSADTRAVNAVLGGVMVGWGLLMYLLSRERLITVMPELPRLLLVSLLAWFVVDSTGSWAAGLPGNIVLNVGFLVMFLPPLVLIRRRSRPDAPA